MKNESARAVVTGAAGGLGKAMALGLLRKGYRVVATDYAEQGLQALAAEAEKSGIEAGKLATFPADLQGDDVVAIVQFAIAQFGRIDILVNNAAIGQAQVRADYHLNPPKFFEVSDAQWRRALSVNAGAIFSLSSAAAIHMMRNGWGRIVNVTTSLATMIRGGYSPYGPSKAAAEALSAIMAADLEGTGVTVNVVVPGGVVDTPMILPPHLSFEVN